MVYAPKRKFTKKPLRRPLYKKKKVSRPAEIKKIVKSVLNRNVETKRSNFTSTDGVEILHNNFITLDTNLLSTTQGVQDPIANDVSCRIGDEIMLKGVSIKCMFELNERYSDVTFRMMVIRCAKGDDPTRATLFSGLSGNKMLDTINSERYTVMAQKWFKLTARNFGSVGSEIVPLTPAGIVGTGTGNQQFVLSRATKIVKLWIPGAKFGKGGKIRYENGSTQVKFFDYRLVVYAYSNYSTLQDIYNVGRINDYVKQMYFKDA
jgi:hypothetical protein